MKDNIIIYENKNGEVELRADIEKDTIWATQAQISDLFETTIPNVNIHLGKIYEEGELDKNRTIKDSLIVRKEGGRAVKRRIELYNLDAIIAVGYRVNSKKATQFRIWATGVLREYLKQGYALNRYKLEKSPEAIEGLNETLALMSSQKYPGKLKGKLVFKLTKNMESKKQAVEPHKLQLLRIS
jgi:hypothetical protein